MTVYQKHDGTFPHPNIETGGSSGAYYRGITVGNIYCKLFTINSMLTNFCINITI